MVGPRFSTPAWCAYLLNMCSAFLFEPRQGKQLRQHRQNMARWLWGTAAQHRTLWKQHVSGASDAIAAIAAVALGTHTHRCSFRRSCSERLAIK
eukprot:5774968-Amphidinium_carterae.1